MYDEWCIDQQLNVLSCINATKYYHESREMTQPREMAIARADSAARDE